MKNVLVLLVVGLLSISMQAQSLRECWLNMPDSVMPTIGKSQRLELVELLDMGVKAEVKNLFGEDCVLDTISCDFLQLSSSPSSVFQVKLLPMDSTKDSLLCVVKTFMGTEKESELHFYTRQWKEMGKESFMDASMMDASSYFSSKPDSMELERYEELKNSVEPKMFYFILSASDETLVAGLSLPLTSVEEKKQLTVLLAQRKFKWYGMMFNKN